MLVHHRVEALHLSHAFGEALGQLGVGAANELSIFARQGQVLSLQCGVVGEGLSENVGLGLVVVAATAGYPDAAHQIVLAQTAHDLADGALADLQLGSDVIEAERGALIQQQANHPAHQLRQSE